MEKRAIGLLTHLNKAESGYATLTAVLILLILGALIITPILIYMDTGLEAGQTHERRTDELYAADAGVNYAVWHLEEYGEVLPGELEGFALNDKDVEVDVTLEEVISDEEQIYKVTSTATSHDAESSTTVESYVYLRSRPPTFLNNAITSRRDVTLQPRSVVNGNVQYGGVLDNKGTINGTVINEEVKEWYHPDELSDFYSHDPEWGVENQTPIVGFPYYSPPDFAGDVINVGDWDELGPLRTDGSLTIKKTGGGPKAVTLVGTIYVKGDLVVEPGCTIVMAGQAIYVEGNAIFQPGCTVTGSGVIVALLDLNFQPNLEAMDEDFLFLLSVGLTPDGLPAEATLTLKPGGAFYGAVAGDLEVILKPGYPFNWTPNPGGMPIPPVFRAQVMTYNIYNYVPD